MCYLLLSILAAAQDVNLTTPNEAMKTIIVLAMGFAAKKKCVLKEEVRSGAMSNHCQSGSTLNPAIPTTWQGHTGTIHLQATNPPEDRA